MPRYRVIANQMYYNAATDSFDAGRITGGSEFQHGDEVEATTKQAESAVKSGDLLKLS
jgi:hypothetical protein